MGQVGWVKGHTHLLLHLPCSTVKVKGRRRILIRTIKEIEKPLSQQTRFVVPVRRDTHWVWGVRKVESRLGRASGSWGRGR